VGRRAGRGWGWGRGATYVHDMRCPNGQLQKGDEVRRASAAMKAAAKGISVCVLAIYTSSACLLSCYLQLGIYTLVARRTSPAHRYC
jgi:hypothetical protein